MDKIILFNKTISAIDRYNAVIEMDGWGMFENVFYKIMCLYLAEIRDRGLEEEFEDYSLCGGEWVE